MRIDGRVNDFLRPFLASGVAVAFSGGVDSTLLLKLLIELRRETPFPLLALTMRSTFQAEEESHDSAKIASDLGVEQQFFDCDPLLVPGLENNPVNRCYLCKHHLFTRFRIFANERGIVSIMDGSNSDDCRVYRPGRQALKELNILSPFAELGITKSDIRETAAALHCVCANKPAAPCLATRFDYGTRLTAEALRRVEIGEGVLRRFLPEAVNLRLRVHGDLARIEVDRKVFPQALQCAEPLVAELKQIGFRHVALDLAGFHSGGYDDGLLESIQKLK